MFILQEKNKKKTLSGFFLFFRKRLDLKGVQTTIYPPAACMPVYIPVRNRFTAFCSETGRTYMHIFDYRDSERFISHKRGTHWEK